TNRYDAFGRRTGYATTRDGGATWDWTLLELDPAGRVARRTRSDGSYSTAAYLPGNRLGETRNRRGLPLTRSYDAAGRLVAESDEYCWCEREWDYDGFGSVSSEDCYYGGITRETMRDARGLATNETVEIDGDVFTLARSFGASGRLESLDAGGCAAGYSYDSENRLASVSNAAFTVVYAYAPDGLTAGYSVACSNGVAVVREVSRDPLRRRLVTGVTNRVNGTVVSAYAYSHDLLGRVVARNGDSFGYDARSQLTSATVSGVTGGYGYDTAGNFSQTSRGGLQTSYSADGMNRYASVAPGGVQESLSYDADGNLAEINGMALGWDARNRVCEIDYGYGWCGYDNTGRPVLSYVGDQTRKWLYDGWNIVRSVHDDGYATETSDYVWGADLSGTLDGAGGVGGLLAVRQDGVWHFPLYDANGNITAYISETGAVSATYAYGPFGETVSHTGRDFEHRFSTKPWDETLGTYTYICRDYSPALGRWLSEDPVLEQGGYNLYSYCGNEPVNKYDLFGFLDVPKSIKVEKCHAYLYIGHSIKNRPIEWQLPEDGGAFAGAICCWSNLNNPDNEWRWPQVPFFDGEIFSDSGFGKHKNVQQGCSMPSNGISYDYEKDSNDNGEAAPTITEMIKKAWSSDALNTIINTLRSKPYCCESVVFEIYVGVDKGNQMIKEAIRGTNLNWQQGEVRKIRIPLTELQR
ncbi:MAG: RHS repeat-associated core domain-containing protein, partial [Kiritimatiellae bacterium]|nr:RHS repeat-associated core domain-containing protein [Kiritimatiellia bacterium]